MRGTSKYAYVKRTATVVAVLLGGVSASRAQETKELAKQAQNPVASLISVPFQSNFNFGAGPNQEMQYVMNIQPVIPFRVSTRWNLITRTILPVIRQPEFVPGVGETLGLGDTQFSMFFTPAKPRGLLWGVGPIVGLPTATSKVLGTEKFSVGPTAVLLSSRGPWVIGGLVNNLFSVAGASSRRDVNQMLIQPFMNYNFKRGWYLCSSPAVTADWKNAAGQPWTLPIGGGFGKILRVGKQPVNLQVQAFGHAIHPEGAARWSLRFQMQLMFPKGRPKG